MTAIVIAADLLIAAACAAGMGLLAWLLRRDRPLIWRPGSQPTGVPAAAVIRRVTGRALAGTRPTCSPARRTAPPSAPSRAAAPRSPARMRTGSS